MAFYPSELFTHPRKTNLEICWFAAIMSKKSFKKRYKSATINKIDITKTCEEILQVHNEVFEIQRKLDSFVLKKKNDSDDEDGHDMTKLFDYGQLELTSDIENDLQLDENLHLLPDHDLESCQLQMRMEALCQDFDAFGSLTDMKLDIMPGHDIEHTISSLEKKMRDIHYNQETELGDVSKMEAKSKESLTPQKTSTTESSKNENTYKEKTSIFYGYSSCAFYKSCNSRRDRSADISTANKTFATFRFKLRCHPKDLCI
ncbi:uncharacterized protein [Anoplolepis gracilipes]|uniref:uncharacterized protein isoform X1 n=1 Tax=Anoplolepis gracilipes TaxID=354296 RepID=UPI003BA23C88